MTRSDTIETLWLIGCGNMGGALLRRWADAGIASRIVAIDPAMPPVPAGVASFAAIADAATAGPPDLVVLAVKPQVAPAALAALPAALRVDTLVVSIMAGLALKRVAALTGARSIRAMPNMPAAIGEGVTALFAKTIDDADRAAVTALFECAGRVLWLDEEAQFDAVTALSGSGPAYVFRFIETLAAAGEAAGLSSEMAAILARQTVVGAAALAAADDRSAQELRSAVTSPGGTTEAGLEALDAEPGLPALLRGAVRAAAARSRELAEQASTRTERSAAS